MTMSSGAGRLRGDFDALGGANAAVPRKTGSLEGDAGGLGTALEGVSLARRAGTLKVKGFGTVSGFAGDLGGCDGLTVVPAAGTGAGVGVERAEDSVDCSPCGGVVDSENTGAGTAPCVGSAGFCGGALKTGAPTENTDGGVDDIGGSGAFSTRVCDCSAGDREAVDSATGSGDG